MIRDFPVQLRIWAIACLAVLVPTLPLLAQPVDINPQPGRKLVVGTKETPPFAFKQENGRWTGLSIELWEAVARKLNWEFEYREMTLGELLEGVKRGQIDLAVSAITMSPEREKVMDFTHTYHPAGLGMAMQDRQERFVVTLFRNLFSLPFLSAVLTLAVVLLAAGLAVWLFERKANPGQFGGKPLEGLGAGFWWSAVTMTTVGYGDKAPQTLGGRVVALVWMFTSIIIISSFTASIASSVTVNRLDSTLLRTRSLSELTLATVTNSTGADYVQSQGLRAISFPSLHEALEALATRSVDAVLYDKPILRYQMLQHPEHQLEVLPKVLVDEEYAIALPSQSPLREALNVAILEHTQTTEWSEVRLRYLGQ